MILPVPDQSGFSSWAPINGAMRMIGHWHVRTTRNTSFIRAEKPIRQAAMEAWLQSLPVLKGRTNMYTIPQIRCRQSVALFAVIGNTLGPGLAISARSRDAPT